jgi:DNA repair protein RadC
VRRDQTLQELLLVAERDPDVAYRALRLVVASRRRTPVRSVNDAVAVLSPLVTGHQEERLAAAFLAHNGTVIAAEVLSIGGPSCSIVAPDVILARALRHEARGFILAHNHPSGALEFSDQDIHATERLKKAAKLLEINLLDHILFAGLEHVSWTEQGHGL